jgi:hypothetical protein
MHRAGMIEASVILFVLLVAGFLFIGARLMAQNTRKDVMAEQARLRASLAWHEERLRQAKLKNWDYEMIHRISEQLDDTRFQLAQITSAQAAASRQNPAS